MKFVVLLAAAMSMSSSFAGSSTQPPQDVKDAVTRNFKDPLAAQFSDVYSVAQGEGKSSFCGWVNGKNSYGGYVGKVRFVVTRLPMGKGVYASLLNAIDDNDKKSPYFDGEENQGRRETVFDNMMWNKNCVDARHVKQYTAR